MLTRIFASVRRAMGGRNSLPPVANLRPEDRNLISAVRERRLTYLKEARLAFLASTCRSIEDKKLPGLFLEAGCALGGSTILLASLKRQDRQLNVYDVFGMIPPPTADDPPEVHSRYQTIVQGQSVGIEGDQYYGYVDDLHGLVRKNLADFGIDCEESSVALIKGLVQDTLVVNTPVALAHIDVDWYDPVRTCLQRVFPHLVVGGSIILDDYHDWGGCRRATDEYLKTIPGQFNLDSTAGSLRIRRTAN